MSQYMRQGALFIGMGVLVDKLGKGKRGLKVGAAKGSTIVKIAPLARSENKINKFNLKR